MSAQNTLSETKVVLLTTNEIAVLRHCIDVERTNIIFDKELNTEDKNNLKRLLSIIDLKLKD